MPGEIFVKMSKQGSVVSGLIDSFAIAISMAMQYGVPMQTLIDKFSHTRFEPSGWTGNKDIPMAKSIVDYIFRWMAIKFLPRDQMLQYVTTTDSQEISTEEGDDLAIIGADEARQDVIGQLENDRPFDNQSDAPPCSTCGEIMVRSGACYKCANCGSTSGCS
jgi:ribonucleoside-diphosphate reductase alpha chain